MSRWCSRASDETDVFFHITHTSWSVGLWILYESNLFSQCIVLTDCGVLNTRQLYHAHAPYRLSVTVSCLFRLSLGSSFVSENHLAGLCETSRLGRISYGQWMIEFLLSRSDL